MRKTFLFSIIALALLGVGLRASAASVFDIEFPIAELGNCADQQACKAYCDDSANKDACIAFGRKFGLVDEQNVQKAEKIKDSARQGPGGCNSETSCRANRSC